MERRGFKDALQSEYDVNGNRIGVVGQKPVESKDETELGSVEHALRRGEEGVQADILHAERKSSQ